MGFLGENIVQDAVTFALWFFCSWLYLGLGITAGYHRLLTHKSYKVPTWLKYFITSGGYMSMMGGPINWVGVHRLHHQKSDQEEDPHSPKKGFKHALYGWMFTMADRQSTEELQRQVPDLMEDKLFRLLGDDHKPYHAQLCFAVCVVTRLAILYFFGWIPFVATVLATLATFMSPQLVNSICHMPSQGYRLWKTREESRNVWWVALLSCGEGWHNTHHAAPRSARHGLMWWELDVTYMFILLLEKVGLATDVVRPHKMPTVDDIHRHGAVVPETVSVTKPAVSLDQVVANSTWTTVPTEKDASEIKPSSVNPSRPHRPTGASVK